MDMYQYVAENDLPSSVKVICSFGFNNFGGTPLQGVSDPSAVADALNQLVQLKGTDALMAVADIHPDKELLYQKFQQEQASTKAASPKQGCGCGCGGGAAHNVDWKPQHYGFAGTRNQQQPSSGFYITQTNAILLAGAALIAIALVAQNN